MLLSSINAREYNHLATANAALLNRAKEEMQIKSLWSSIEYISIT